MDLKTVGINQKMFVIKKKEYNGAYRFLHHIFLFFAL
jgi:hypothetical protein